MDRFKQTHWQTSELIYMIRVSFWGPKHILKCKFIGHTTFFFNMYYQHHAQNMQLEVDIQLELELEKSAQIGICLCKQWNSNTFKSF